MTNYKIETRRFIEATDETMATKLAEIKANGEEIIRVKEIIPEEEESPGA